MSKFLKIIYLVHLLSIAWPLVLNGALLQEGFERAKKFREEKKVVYLKENGESSFIVMPEIKENCKIGPDIYFRGIKKQGHGGLNVTDIEKSLNEFDAVLAAPYSFQSFLNSKYQSPPIQLADPTNTSSGLSAFVRFSKKADVAGFFSYSDSFGSVAKEGVVIVYYGKVIDVQCQNPDSGWRREAEVVVPGLVYADEIIAYIPQNNRKLGNIIINPKFSLNIEEIWPTEKRKKDLAEIQRGLSTSDY